MFSPGEENPPTLHSPYKQRYFTLILVDLTQYITHAYL